MLAREHRKNTDFRKSPTDYLVLGYALVLFEIDISDFRSYCRDFGSAEMAGSGRFLGWWIPTPMPGWQACRPPADPELDHRARPIVLENYGEVQVLFITQE